MTKKISSIYKTFDVVTIPFPFTDQKGVKNRPAIVISSDKTFNNDSGHSIFAMITSARHNLWPLDISIKDSKSCGLEKPSIIRLKLFTMDHRLIINKIGKLSLLDQKSIKKNISMLFQDLWK